MENRLRAFLEGWTSDFIEDYKGKLPDGSLKDSVTSRVVLDLNEIRITLYLNEYWKYVENGRKPGKFPPLNRMLEFARKVIPKPYTLPSGKQVIPNERQLAFLIGRSIAQNGVKPKHYLRDSLNSKKKELVDGLKEILVDEFKEIILKVN